MSYPSMTDYLPEPVLYAFLDHRLFLAEWFAWKQSTNPRYSYRVFARAAGIGNPSLLKLVCQGSRNLTPGTVPGFARALKLDREAARFFELLVKLERASDPGERNRLWSRIAATRRFREARRLEADSFTYLSHWYIPATRELAGRADFRADPEWVAAALRPAIKLAEARRALDVLCSLGLITVDEQGGASPADGSVVTPHEIARLAVANYYRGMIGLGAEAVERFDGTQRHLGAVTALVSRELLPRLKAEVAAFTERILDLADSEEAEGEVVYQLNVQLFPLSHPSEETP